MESKKERFKFLKKILEKARTLEPNQKKLLIIISSVVLALVIITIVTSIIFSSVIGDAGKVIGNLNNLGFAAQKGKKVYISNTAYIEDGEVTNGLYEISKNNATKIIEKVDDNGWIKSINVYKGYLYYLSIRQSDDGTSNYVRQIIKVKPNGKNRTVLVDGIKTQSVESDSVNVSSGWVYYLNEDSKLEKVKINGEKRQQISDVEIANFQISGKYIYYTTKDQELGRMKKDGSARKDIDSGINTFQVVDDNVYYISIANDHLIKLDVNKGTKKEIVNEKVTHFNIYQKTIYYAITKTEDNGETTNAIYKMKTNEKEKSKVTDVQNAYTAYMCVVGKWMYYIDQLEDGQIYYSMYKIKTNGEDKQKVTFNK